MANLFKLLLRHTLFAKSGSLVALEDPYTVIANLLRGHQVRGLLDAGASNGRISRRLLRLFPDAQAYAFEPNPLYEEMLKQYAREDPRFHPQFLALSDEEADIRLLVMKSPGTTSMFVPSKRLKAMYPKETDITSVETIKAVTIDSWVEHNDNPDIQLMKFDIQGAELRALRGATRVLQTSTLLVYTEVFLNPLYDGGAIFSEIDLCLRDSGFLFYTILKPRCDKSGLMIQGNAIFVHAERLRL